MFYSNRFAGDIIFLLYGKQPGWREMSKEKTQQLRDLNPGGLAEVAISTVS